MSDVPERPVLGVSPGGGGDRGGDGGGDRGEPRGEDRSSNEPATSAAPDATLVRRTLRGDREAFGALVDRHLESALAVASRLSGSREDAEDLVQDAFLRALDQLDRFDPARPFRPWFLRVLTNLGLNRARAEALRAHEPLPDSAIERSPGPDRLVERAETESRVREALGELSERQRLVVTLFELEGLSSREVGEVLDLSPATVRWHLMEARKVLRDRLSPEGQEPGDSGDDEESNHA